MKSVLMGSRQRLYAVIGVVSLVLSTGTLTIAAVSAHVMFVTSDKADEIFLKSLNINNLYKVHCNIRGFDKSKILYILDYNVASCNNTLPLGLDKLIIKLLSKGGTIVLGYNTLRYISLFEPRILQQYGIVLTDSQKGIRNIIVGEELVKEGAPRTILYKAYLYHYFELIPHIQWKVLAHFDNGDPAIVEAHIGHGRLVLVLFNPVWPGINGQQDYTRLVRALHKYIERNGYSAGALLAMSSGLIGLSMVTLYQASNVNQSEQLIRRGVKPITLVALLAYKTKREDVSKHPIRKQIARILESRHFVTLDIVMDEIGVSRSTALWHLEIMVRLKYLSSEKIAGKWIYYYPYDRNKAILAFLLLAKPRRKIVSILAREGMTLTRLARRLRMSKSTVKHHLDVLIKYGVVVYRDKLYRLSENMAPLVRDLLKHYDLEEDRDSYEASS